MIAVYKYVDKYEKIIFCFCISGIQTPAINISCEMESKIVLEKCNQKIAGLD